MKCMEKFTKEIKDIFSDEKKRTTAIVGAGIAVATIFTVRTLTKHMREKKK